MRFVREYIQTHQHFSQAVRWMSPPIEGLAVRGDVVVVLPSSELYAKGVRSISGFSKYEGEYYEIAFLDEHDELLSVDQAKEAGLEDQVHIFEASELRSFLVKLVNQTC
jgi:hypothetical protein